MILGEMTALYVSSAFGVMQTELNHQHVRTLFLSFIRTLISKLIIDFSSLNEICFLLVLQLQFLRETSKKHLHRFCFLRFCCFRSVVLDSSEIGLGSIMLKLICFLQLFSILYFILDPKTLRFPCCRSFLGTKGKRSPDGLRIYPRRRLASWVEPDWHLECSREEQQFLVKRKQDFQS